MRSLLSLFFLCSVLPFPVCMVSLINIVKFRELCVGTLVEAWLAWLLCSITIHYAVSVDVFLIDEISYIACFFFCIIHLNAELVLI